ncbi:hypothetical protein [Paenibacillus faecalis]|uniref:hypothetical protein n=1 Tax=Paenibacillus faecalis TaxID=2079532 RepID=UPI000D0EDAE9|nr:hypothetical protein [Paenibacillus faecalis]
MRISKLIDNIMADYLHENGFDYEERFSHRWLFTRNTQKGKEYIEIDKSNLYQNAIRASFYNGYSETTAMYLLEGNLIKEWFFYHDEPSLCETLKLILSIIMNQGLAWFEHNSSPEESLPENYLSDDLKASALHFIKNHSLSYTDYKSLVL